MPALHFEAVDGVGWIRLARPEKRNPFDTELRAELIDALTRVREDAAIRVAVLAGSPGAFCAGGNLQMLREKADAGPAYWQARIGSGLRVIQDLLNLPKPLIAVVDGPAFGAGFSLALTADLVLASPRARFAMSYLKLGLVPDLGPMYLLPRMVGLQRAKEIFFSTRELDAEEARALGLVLEVHPSELIEARAATLAASLCKASPAALAMTKATLNISLDSDRASLFALEAASQAAAFGAPEPLQAIEALLARQAPPYTGFAPDKP
jgi:enoyl-CoA hydratase/carnithine racemase